MLWLTVVAIAVFQFLFRVPMNGRADAFLMSALFGSALLFLLFFNGISQTASSFRQRLTVLGPYISDATRKELESQWAAMRNRSDYQKLIAKTEEIAAQNQIKLPRARP